jgi:hypothetical protein
MSPDDEDTVPNFVLPELMFPTPRAMFDRYLPAVRESPPPEGNQGILDETPGSHA